MTRQRAAIVEKVAESLCSKRPGCFLIEAPPGCNHPDVLGEIWQLVSERLPQTHMICRVSADGASDDADLVRTILAEWTRGRRELSQRWMQYSGDLLSPETPPATVLKSFVNVLARDEKLVLLCGKFEALFWHMSHQLLAALRDLEHDRRLASVNVSPFGYGELYQRRARRERGFTSDYGQVHVRLRLGTLSEIEARAAWESEFDVSLDADRQHGARFRLAYRESAGVPASFHMAMQVGGLGELLAETIPMYQEELRTRLQETFSRLLRYDESETGNAMASAVASGYLGVATAQEWRILQTHPWANLIVTEESGGPKIRCDALGRQALAMSADGHERTDVVALYKGGHFAACNTRAQRSPGTHPLLAIAAELLACVFRGSARNLYFEGSVPWKRVRDLAAKAEQLCPTQEDAEEFASWRRIAEAYSTAPRPDRTAIENHLFEVANEPEGVQRALLRLGTRILAIKRDDNATTAAYMAVPIVEDALRHYVAFVLKCPLRGEAFEALRADEIKAWWSRGGDGGDFVLPRQDGRLGGAELVMLAAAMSARSGSPLFGSTARVAGLLSALDEVRNLFGHYVTAGVARSKELVDTATAIFERACTDSRFDLSLEQVGKMVSPPRLFLRHCSA